MGKKCPQCRVWCTDSASRCDCGYDFVSQRRHPLQSGSLPLWLKWALLGGALVTAVAWVVAPMGSPVAWGMVVVFPAGLLEAVGLSGRGELESVFLAPIAWVLYVFLGWALLASSQRRYTLAIFGVLCAMLALNVAGLYGWRLWR